MPTATNLAAGYRLLRTQEEVNLAILQGERDYTAFQFYRHGPGDRTTPGGRNRPPTHLSHSDEDISRLQQFAFAELDAGRSVLHGPFSNIFSVVGRAVWHRAHQENGVAQAERSIRESLQNLDYWHNRWLEGRQQVAAAQRAPTDQRERVLIPELLAEISTWDDVLETGVWPIFPDTGQRVGSQAPFFWVRFMPTIIRHPREPQYWSLTTQVDVVFALNGAMPSLGFTVFHPHGFRGQVCWGAAEGAMVSQVRSGHLLNVLELVRRWKVGISSGLLFHTWNSAAFYLMLRKMGRGHLLDCPVWDAADGTAKRLGDIYPGWQDEKEAYVAGRMLYWMDQSDAQRQLSHQPHHMVEQLIAEYEAVTEEPGVWGDYTAMRTYCNARDESFPTVLFTAEEAMTAFGQAAANGGHLWGAVVGDNNPVRRVLPEGGDQGEPEEDEEDEEDEEEEDSNR
jgi:hypothetical protein